MTNTTATTVPAPLPAVDTLELSSTRGTAEGGVIFSSTPDFCSTDSVLVVKMDVVLVTVVVVVVVVEVFVVVVVLVVVVEGGVGDLVVVACTVTFIVAYTFLPLFLLPPHTYSSTSHLAIHFIRNITAHSSQLGPIIQIFSS